MAADSDKKICAKTFIEASETSVEILKIKAIVKDATFYKYITAKSDNMLYETATNTALGRNVSEVLEYMLNPINDDVLDRLMENVESLWSK